MAQVADHLKPAVPVKFRKKIAAARVSFRGPTNRFRSLPDFMIFGAGRAATLLLYHYLGSHPCVIRPLRKHTEYFSRNYDRGVDWYRSLFPTRVTKSALSVVRRHPILTFEASGDYLVNPYAAERAKKVIPDAKLIVVLRDPVERAFQHYLHTIGLGVEDRPFAEALALEHERIAPDIEMMRKDPLYHCSAYYHFSYVEKGKYAEMLERWLAHFPPSQFLIVPSEELFDQPARTIGHVVDFLDLPEWDPPSFDVYVHEYEGYFRDHTYPGRTVAHAPMEAATRQKLVATFAPLNERLEDLLRREFGWGNRRLGWDS
jgi:hypothetical protein